MILSLVVLCLGVLIGTQFTGLAEAAPLPNKTATVEQGNVPLSSDDAMGIQRFICRISEVDEWVDGVSSILIGCFPGDGDIAFFAEPTSDPKRAARILGIALTAQAVGKPVFIDYDPANTNVVGCSSGNCRNIFRIGMYN